MKFSCENSILSEMISSAMHAVTSKSTIPALEGILVNADDKLSLTGFDLEVGIKTTCEAYIEEKGRVVINGRLLWDIVRKLPDNMITVTCDEKLHVTITCGVSVFNLIGTSPSDYPELPVVAQERFTTLPQNTLKKIIQGTIFSASENDSRPILTGCLFKISGDELMVVALDSYRLAMRCENVKRDNSTENLSFVVPAKALREVDRFLQDSEENISISISSRHIRFSFGDTVLIARLLEGEYLNYSNAIPKVSAHRFKVKTEELISSLDRVSLITNDKLKNFVKCTFENDVVRFSCTTAIGQSYDECRLSPMEGGALTIGFNSRYLLEALHAARDEEVILELSQPTSPCLIKPVEGDAYLYLVLPVRLKV